jgi:hypothetical protein
LISPSNFEDGGSGVMPLSRNRAFGDKPNSAPIRRMSSMACEAIRTSGLIRVWPSAVLIVNSPERCLNAPTSRTGEQVETMQLGREVKPRLSRMACQLLW